MSPLARLLVARGATVIGSDRSFDAGRNTDFFQKLAAEGIKLVPQDGSGVTPAVGSFIVTRAVEESSPDIQRARELAIPIVRRPALMAQLFATSRNVAVGGTSGKSTTTGMIGWVLQQAGLRPTIVNGAEMIDFGSNVVVGSDLAVFEADESDGLNDVVGCCPASIAVLTNISLDHFELAELEEIFGAFVERATEGVVLNADCPLSMKLRNRARRVVTFGIAAQADITPADLGGDLSIRGAHNIANALAALGAVKLLGGDIKTAAQALRNFRGMRRRLELVDTPRGVKIFDDFASNPGKIGATVETLRREGSRLIAIFQPHGFQPTKMMLEGYVETFSHGLRSDDMLFVTPIYYAGGSANLVAGKKVDLPTDISGNDIVLGVSRNGRTARYLSQRQELEDILPKIIKAGDVVVSMGSRDETLPEFVRALASKLRSFPTEER